jgi:hypothetical protein
MKKGLFWLIKKNIVFICACVLFLILCIRTFEPYINSNASSIVQMSEDLVSKIEIVYARNNDPWINLADLRILDENDNVVEYWDPPNSAHFDNGDLGWLHGDVGSEPYHGAIRYLWDGLPNTNAHSTTAPDTLRITLVPERKISSIQITNRNGWEKRITSYDLVLKNKDDIIIGKKPLIKLGDSPGMSITYLLSKSAAKGEKGDKGDKGDQG